MRLKWIKKSRLKIFPLIRDEPKFLIVRDIILKGELQVECKMLNELTRIKIELLCCGVRLGADTLRMFPGYRYKRASLSEGVCFNLHGCSDSVVPVNLAVHEPFVSCSPFYFNEPEGIIYKGDSTFVAATLVNQPSWYGRRLPDGTCFQEILQIHYEQILALSLTNFCVFKQQGKGCKFCALGSDISEQCYKDPEHIIRVIEELRYLKVPFKEVNLNSGAFLNEDKGISMFLDGVRAIRSVSDVPIYVQICPPEDKTFIDDLRAEGVTTISFNLEIYNQVRRREMMPAKSLYDREDYFRTLRYAVDLFGPNQVSSWLIAGLEPTESTIAGIWRVAETGAIPFVTIFRPLIGSDLVDESPPHHESIFPVFEALREVMEVTGLDPRASRGGCVSCGCCSALMEVKSG